MNFCQACGGAVRPIDSPISDSMTNLPVSKAATLEATPILSFDFKRLGTGDFIAGGGIFILIISLFLPWFSYYGNSKPAISKLWPVLIVFIGLAIVGYLLARALMETAIRLPLPHWQLLCVVTIFVFLLVAACFFTKPSGYSWSYGGFIGIAASVAGVAGSFYRRSERELLNMNPPPPGSSPFSAIAPLIERFNSQGVKKQTKSAKSMDPTSWALPVSSPSPAESLPQSPPQPPIQSPLPVPPPPPGWKQS